MQKNYYKLIDNNTVIGAISSSDFLRFDVRLNFVVWCSDEDGEFVQYHDMYYRDNWLRPMKTDTISAKLVSIAEIGFSEYEELYGFFEGQKDNETSLSLEVIEEPIAESITINPDLEETKLRKIKELRGLCNMAITNGFDTQLSDGLHHFSFSTNDQLNILSMQNMIQSGETDIPYHADGELYIFYSVEDAQRIINAANAHKTYHLSYYNSLKNYVNTLETDKQIEDIYYGMEIPIDFQSNVLKFYSN